MFLEQCKVVHQGIVDVPGHGGLKVPGPNGIQVGRSHSIDFFLHRKSPLCGHCIIIFRGLQHCFATLSLEQGMDIKTVSHMLGHTDAGFTMSTYMHVTDSMQENVANTMGNLLGGNVANS
ncbi:MAG: hypothetical protein EGR79_08905 [Ruminococcaceae bacterium]|nr:hypothetical protein [Oscillospiraceae bacterium]